MSYRGDKEFQRQAELHENKKKCKICGRDLRLDGKIINTTGYCRLCHLEEMVGGSK